MKQEDEQILPPLPRSWRDTTGLSGEDRKRKEKALSVGGASTWLAGWLGVSLLELGAGCDITEG